jgi:disulfide bond formation protein DsbB
VALFASLRRIWPVAAAAVSVAMLGSAHAFERFGGYAPCNLCLKQREVYWGALALALVGIALTRLKRMRPEALALALAAVFLAGALVAAFHAGVEWKWWPGPTTCVVAGTISIDTSDLAKILAGASSRAPACDVAAWRLLGLSMAGYNALISLALAAIGFAAAFGRSSR